MGYLHGWGSGIPGFAGSKCGSIWTFLFISVRQVTVVFGCHRDKVLGVDARAVPAVVMQILSGRQASGRNQIGKAVGHPHGAAAAAGLKASVTLAAFTTAGPKPTGIAVRSGSEANVL